MEIVVLSAVAALAAPVAATAGTGPVRWGTVVLLAVTLVVGLVLHVDRIHVRRDRWAWSRAGRDAVTVGETGLRSLDVVRYGLQMSVRRWGVCLAAGEGAADPPPLGDGRV